MSMRHSAMSVRRGFVIRVTCLVLFCSLVIYAIHLYRKIYNFSNRYQSLASRLHENNIIMDSSRSPQFLLSQGDGSGAGSSGGGLGSIQGAPVVKLDNKIVHFDLKGMPPTVEAYKTIFPFLKNIGVTGILMEYEDMFPFHGKLQPAANKACYNVSDIKTILGLAQANNLQVIPLIQTFGHLEFFLKLDEFASYREVSRYPQVICPTNNQSVELIKEMIDQVMSLHPDVEYLHIGSDEVYYIGMCPLCQDRMNRFRIDATDLFLQHAKIIAGYVKEKHKVQPLMWDDEFRNLDEKIIAQYGVGDLVEIVVWNYHPDVPSRLRPNLWQKYANIFKSVWVGSAFKGADKPNSMVANETHYLSNHYSWMGVMSEYQSQINFKGIFLTGWQRYDHFSVLCEIFPVAVPSLVSCMFYLSSYGQQPRMEKIFSIASAYLDCGIEMLMCRFPGSQVYNEVLTLKSLENSLTRIKEQSVFLGWTQRINLQLQFSSPSHIESVLQEVVKLRIELQQTHGNLMTALRSMFPEWSVQEWMFTYFQPLASDVTSLEESLGKLAKKTTFPVRPLDLPSSTMPRSSQPEDRGLNDL